MFFIAFIRDQLIGNGLLKIDHWNTNNNKWTTDTLNNFPSNTPRLIVDERKVGDIFILVFKDEIGIRKLAHHAVLVDVAGASNEVNLKGVLLHLTANSKSRRSKFRFGDKPWRRNIFYEPRGNELFDELTDNGTNRKWSSSINCQIFCKMLLKRFDFKWPADLPCIVDDMVPIIIDLTIGFISNKARKYKESDDDDDDDSDNMIDDE